MGVVFRARDETAQREGIVGALASLPVHVEDGERDPRGHGEAHRVVEGRVGHEIAAGDVEDGRARHGRLRSGDHRQDHPLAPNIQIYMFWV